VTRRRASPQREGCRREELRGETILEDGGAVAAGSRFDSSTAQGKLYRDRYLNDAYLDALGEIHRSCEGHGLDAVSVALRWLVHHSQLYAERNDGIIIGASSLEQLRHNLTAVTEGPLPTDVLTAIDDAALKAQPKWPPYFYGVEGFGPGAK
jgi:aflatoxin B1 aldehyde reductase